MAECLNYSGSGKATAVAYFVDASKKRKISCIHIVLSPGDELESYKALRRLIRTILGDSVWQNAEDRANEIKIIFQESPSARNLKYDISTACKQLSSILNDFSDSKTSDQVLLNFFEAKFSSSVCTLVIEKAEYCDDASWRVLRLLLLSQFQLLILLSINSPVLPQKLEPNDISSSSNQSTCFPFFKVFSFSKSIPHCNFRFLRNGIRFHPCQDMTGVLQSGNTSILEIKGMDEEEVGNILIQALSHDDIPQDLVKNVIQVTSGNPFWCKAIANHIRDYGRDTFLDIVKDGHLKDSLLFVIICRVEKLSPIQQTILKYASIVGTKFSSQILSGILPLNYIENLRQDIHILEDHGFIYYNEDEFSEDVDTYVFHNELIHQTIYDLLPKSASKDLHTAIARVYIELFKMHPEKYFAVISFHFATGESDFTEAFDYSMKASSYAMAKEIWPDTLFYAQQAKSFITVSADIDELLILVKDARKILSNSIKRKKSPVDTDILDKLRVLYVALQFEKSQWQIDDSLADFSFLDTPNRFPVPVSGGVANAILNTYRTPSVTTVKSSSFSNVSNQSLSCLIS